MRCITYFLITSLTPLAHARITSFIPANAFVCTQKKLKSNALATAFIADPDLERAAECADNFGKCPIKEMETLKNKLHTERLALFLDETFGVSSPIKPEDEIGHRVLEEYLSLQLSLLKDEIGVQQKKPEEVAPPIMSMDGAIAMDELQWGRERTVQPSVPEPSLQYFVQQGMRMLMLGTGVYDGMVLCAAMLFIFLAHMVRL